ncbi:A1S_1983 family putative colistin resistance protein [Acinetobacter sp. WZC-1]|uniref:A1S_1983 family putative colistin resistance protein n=1 Tax=Acinetobacter sp. WZC-1 TaxID=3459034 RepID=UPI00403DF1FA
MLLKTEINLMKNIVSVLFMNTLISIAGMSVSHAQPIQCDAPVSSKILNQLCAPGLEDLRLQLNEKYLTAWLVTDAPTHLLNDTHALWFKRLQQCKNSSCLQQQLDLRLEDLNFYTSMNQSLTQHFLKYENGVIAAQPAYLQVHQLTRDRIKIEGLAYRNPNNRMETQAVSLLAYTTPEKKNEIVDNEHDCKYQMNFQKAMLIVQTTQKGCERFSGIYRLYD